MNEDRSEGTVKNAGGKLQEGLGRATGDVKSQVEGTVKQAVGTAQDLYGQARETAGDAAAIVRRQAGSLEQTVREGVETKYTAGHMLARLVFGRLGRSYWPSAGVLPPWALVRSRLVSQFAERRVHCALMHASGRIWIGDFGCRSEPYLVIRSSRCSAASVESVGRSTEPDTMAANWLVRHRADSGFAWTFELAGTSDLWFQLLEALPVAVTPQMRRGASHLLQEAAVDLWGHARARSDQWCGCGALLADGRPLP